MTFKISNGTVRCSFNVDSCQGHVKLTLLKTTFTLFRLRFLINTLFVK